MNIILNRNLNRSDIPLHSYVEITDSEGKVPYCEYPRSLAELRRLALTFDLDWYQREHPDLPETKPYLKKLRDDLGSPLAPDMSELRAGLILMYHWYGKLHSFNEETANLVDDILDALYRELSGGRERPNEGLGEHQPGIGFWQGENASWSHQRFWFETARRIDRSRLYELVAAQLLRKGVSGQLIRGLYLEPPQYGDDPDGVVSHIFTFCGRPYEDSNDEGERLVGEPEQTIPEVVRAINASGFLGE